MMIVGSKGMTSVSLFGEGRVIVSYDYDFGWIVEVPVLHSGGAMEYEFAWNHIDPSSKPSTCAEAVRLAKAISENFALPIQIYKKPSGVKKKKALRKPVGPVSRLIANAKAARGTMLNAEETQTIAAWLRSRIPAKGAL